MRFAGPGGQSDARKEASWALSHASQHQWSRACRLQLVFTEASQPFLLLQAEVLAASLALTRAGTGCSKSSLSRSWERGSLQLRRAISSFAFPSASSLQLLWEWRTTQSNAASTLHVPKVHSAILMKGLLGSVRARGLGLRSRASSRLRPSGSPRFRLRGRPISQVDSIHSEG